MVFATEAEQSNLASSTDESNPIDHLQQSLNAVNPILGGVIDFVAGDYLNLAKQAVNLMNSGEEVKSTLVAVGNAVFSALGSLAVGNVLAAQQSMAGLQKHSATILKIGAFLGAAAWVAVKFMPLGKVASLATEKLGSSLGSNVCKKVMTDKLEKKLASTAAKAVTDAVEKTGEKSIEKLLDIQKNAIADVVEKQVAKIVEDDVHKVLMAVNSKFSTKASIASVLKGVGLGHEEAIHVAEDLVKSNLRGKLGSFTAVDQVEKILIESMTKSFNRTFEQGLQAGVYGSVFKSELAKHYASSKLSQEMQTELLKGADEVFEGGVKLGAKRGIEKGVKDAVKRFRRDRIRVSQDDYFRVMDSGELMLGTTHGAGLLSLSSWTLNSKGLDNTWKEGDFTDDELRLNNNHKAGTDEARRERRRRKNMQ